jgi:hypothetical protein
MLHLAADPAQLRKDRFGERAPLVEMTPTIVGDPIEFLRPFGFDERIAKLFEISERGVHHPGTGAVEAAGTLLERLDDLVPVTRLFFEKRQDHELQVVAPQLAPGSKPMNAASAAAGHPAKKSERARAYTRAAMPSFPKPTRKSMMHHNLLYHQKTYRKI